MTTYRCRCGVTVTLTGPMDLWDVPMLRHLRSHGHAAAGRSIWATRGTAGDRSSASTSGKVA